MIIILLIYIFNKNKKIINFIYVISLLHLFINLKIKTSNSRFSVFYDKLVINLVDGLIQVHPLSFYIATLFLFGIHIHMYMHKLKTTVILVYFKYAVFFSITAIVTGGY